MQSLFFTKTLPAITGLLLLVNISYAQLPPAFSPTDKKTISKDELSRYYITPTRIVWMSDSTGKYITDPQLLLNQGIGQTVMGKTSVCKLINKGNITSGIVLDFGKEIQGGIQITLSQGNRVTPKVRLRFGESVSETMSDVIGDGTTGKEGGATNHHSLRDFMVQIPGLGSQEVGREGFRFVRIDLADSNASIAIKEIRAVATMRDLPYLGSFKSNDTLLNKIWMTGAYTVHLNMQDYLWDGIKRDRLIWIGDMHPETMTISNVFGNNAIVPKSLDFVRDHTPLPGWMNGIPSYSMWWIIMQRDWYYFHGDKKYLLQQKPYLLTLLDALLKKVDANGDENLDGFRFLDWPSSENKPGVHAGLQAMMVIAFDKGAELCTIMGETKQATIYKAASSKMRLRVPDANHSKQAACLMALAGMIPAEKVNREVIAVNGVEHFSTYFGYYMLQAQAKAGAYETAINNIRQYWGGMLKLGATTFWEDFDLAEAANAAPIDNIVPPGKLDYHRNTGAYCFIGLRRSLCHGWASGPTSWLTENVLGIHVTEPGCRTIKLEPHLGDLAWAEGTFPTPYGIVKVKHVKLKSGKIQTTVSAPAQVRIIKS
jgi:alpha-L-rhamnosidase